MRLAIACVTIGTVATPLAGQDRLSGSWEGYWTRAGDTLPVTMTVQLDPRHRLDVLPLAAILAKRLPQHRHRHLQVALLDEALGPHPLHQLLLRHHLPAALP